MSLGESEGSFCAASPLFGCVKSDSDDSSLPIDDGYVAPLKSLRSSNNFTGFGSMDPIIERRSICSLPPSHIRRCSVTNDTRDYLNLCPGNVPVAALPPAKSTFSLDVSIDFEYELVDLRKLKLTNETFWRRAGDSARFEDIANGYFRSESSTFAQKLWNALQLSLAGCRKQTGVAWKGDYTIEVQRDKFAQLLGMKEATDIDRAFAGLGFRDLTDEECPFAKREDHKYVAHNVFQRNCNVIDIEWFMASGC